MIGADSLTRLLQSLATLPGSFEKYPPAGTPSFSGDRSILNAIAEFGDEAVVRLVECLDDTSYAGATWQGHPVPIGRMCYEALTITAYHEATDESGDIDASWPGYMPMMPTIEELRAAREAWEEVVQRRAYILP